MKTSRTLALALLQLALAACTNETVDPDREYTLVLEDPAVVAGNPYEKPPGDATDHELRWLQALDRADVGDPVAPGLEDELFGAELALSLEDLYVELWHDGGALAERLLDAVRGCDASAAIRFGMPLVVLASEIEPPSEWPCELRYLEGDPRGRAAAELLRDHLREGCTGAARAAVRSIIEEQGLVLRPVPEFRYAGDPGHQSPLLLVVTTRERPPAERGSGQ